jgi:hypothetical protein
MNSIRNAIAAAITATLCTAALPAHAAGYDDAAVSKIFVENVGPGGTGKRKALCSYGYTNTGTSTTKVPWTAVQFYLRKPAGAAIEPYYSAKTCVGPSCTTAATVPAIAPPGQILGCRIVLLQNNAELKDAIEGNNSKEIFVSANAAPDRSAGTHGGGPTAAGTMGVAGVAPDYSGNVKQCQTSLAATVTPAPQQFAAPLNGPADFAPGKIVLHLKSSQTAGNSFVCRYSSQGKDVADFAVTIQCPNAAPRAGVAHTFGCTG